MPLTSFYMASRFEDKDEAHLTRDAVAEATGATCTARWIDAEESDNSPEARKRYAEECTEDVLRADAVVLLNPASAHRTGTGGRHVETGIAVATGKPVFVYGAAESIFHHLRGIQVFADLDALVAAFKAETPPRPIHSADAFQAWTRTVAKYPEMNEKRVDAILYPVLGACGELGELASVILAAVRNARGCDVSATLLEAEAVLEKVVAAGQHAEQLKRPIREGRVSLPMLRGPTPEERERISKEYGDCLWYGVRLLDEAGFKPSEVMASNVAKIEGRKSRGTLHGSGENR